MTWREGGNPPTADVKINGQDGTVYVSGAWGNSYTVSWSSQNATSCTLNGQSVGTSGSKNVSINNSCNNAQQCFPQTRCITLPYVYYNETYNLTCSNASGQASDSATAVVHPRVCSN